MIFINKTIKNYLVKISPLFLLFIILIIILVMVEIYIYLNSHKLSNKVIDTKAVILEDANKNTPAVVILEDVKKNTQILENSDKVKRHIFGDYEVIEILNVITPEECDKIIELTKKKGLNESEVLSYGTENTTVVDKNFRICKQSWYSDSDDIIFTKIAKYNSDITQMPIENQEMTQIGMYTSGGKFNEHIDACAFEDKEYCDNINKHSGQRRYTLLIYLNDDFEGGETEFTKLNLKIKPEKGKAIFFKSTDENEVIYQQSMHRGNEVINGEKWIATKWTHFKEYK